MKKVSVGIVTLRISLNINPTRLCRQITPRIMNFFLSTFCVSFKSYLLVVVIKQKKSIIKMLVSWRNNLHISAGQYETTLKPNSMSNNVDRDIILFAYVQPKELLWVANKNIYFHHNKNTGGGEGPLDTFM